MKWGSLTLREIAAQVHRDPGGVLERARQLGLPWYARPMMSSRDLLFAREDAATLLASYPPQPEEDWLTAAQAARILGIDKPGTFSARRVRGALQIEMRELTGPGVRGRQCRYNPVDVAREAARRGIRPRTTPRGAMTPSELCTVLGTNLGTLHSWAKDGCPHGVRLSGFKYWRPAEVVAWLSAQRHPLRRRYARALRRHLDQQEAA